MTFKVPRGQLLALLKEGNADVAAAIENGRQKSMKRAVAELQRRSPVSDGRFRAAWRVTDYGVVNDAPYAGVIERGARPHPVSEEGVQAIMDWVAKNFTYVVRSRGPGAVRQRRIGLLKSAKAQAEIRKIAEAIAWKIRKEGQEPTWLVRKILPLLEANLHWDVDAALHALADRGAA